MQQSPQQAPQSVRQVLQQHQQAVVQNAQMAKTVVQAAPKPSPVKQLPTLIQQVCKSPEKSPKVIVQPVNHYQLYT